MPQAESAISQNNNSLGIKKPRNRNGFWARRRTIFAGNVEGKDADKEHLQKNIADLDGKIDNLVITDKAKKQTDFV